MSQDNVIANDKTGTKQDVDVCLHVLVLNYI